MNLEPYIRHGWSVAAIARRVGVTRQAMQQRLARQGVTGASLKATRVARLRAAYNPKHSLRHNATRLGIARNTLAKVMRGLRK